MELYEILESKSELEYNKMIMEAINNEEYVIIGESFYSKKDLQDPKTLERMLNRAKTEKKIKNKIDLLLFAFTFIETHLGKKFLKSKNIDVGFINTVLSWLAIALATGGATFKGNKFLGYIHENRIKKLKAKCEKLRDSMKDSDDPKAKEIVNNCNKLLNEIDKYYKDEAKKVYDKKVKEYKEMYTQLQYIISGKIEDIDPFDLTSIFAMAKILGISFDKIEKGAIKNIGENESLCMLYFGENYRDLDEKKKYLYSDLAEIVKEFKTDSLKYKLYYAIDDTVLYYAPSIHKFIYGDYQPEDAKSLYSNLFEIVEKSKYFKEEYEKNLKLYEEEKEIIFDVIDKANNTRNN